MKSQYIVTKFVRIEEIVECNEDIVTKLVTCCKCKATYSSWTYLRKHMEDCMSDKYLECDKCEMKSELKEKMGDHK